MHAEKAKRGHAYKWVLRVLNMTFNRKLPKKVYSPQLNDQEYHGTGDIAMGLWVL